MEMHSDDAIYVAFATRCESRTSRRNGFRLSLLIIIHI